MKTVSPQKLLAASKADMIPSGWSGLWSVRKLELPIGVDTEKGFLEAGSYTHLFRLTDSTIFTEPPGVCVMEDTPFELKAHLDFMLKARGQVLVTGLGLGCVVRGLLANPNVEHVTCLENSTDVLKLVQPHMPKERLTIVKADALEWQPDMKFDCAWHDLWTDRDAGEPHLNLWHTRLIFNFLDYVKDFQGAWAMPRFEKRFLRQKQLDIVG